jgi:hypothetical protein
MRAFVLAKAHRTWVARHADPQKDKDARECWQIYGKAKYREGTFADPYRDLPQGPFMLKLQ